jgi:uncharacterized OB-fold protein
VSRPRPVPTADERAFWAGGAEGRLLVHRCRACRQWFHPPAPVCPHCHDRDVGPEQVSGRATVWAATVNHQPWFPSIPPPYVVAIVELVEQPGLRMLSNVVGCAPELVVAGLTVTVEFEPLATDIWLPVFRPSAA